MIIGRLGMVWALVGVSLLLGSAIVRLAHHVVTMWAMHETFAASHWAALVGGVVLMAYFEGYKGFQRGFSPRVVARALTLLHGAPLLRLLFAPLFAMGFFHATRRRLIVSYVLTLTIIGLVVIVSWIEQPWRGIVDAGVVVGLAWGLLAMFSFAARAVGGRPPQASPELPSHNA